MIANQEMFDLAVKLKEEMSQAKDVAELQAIAKRIEAMVPDVIHEILLVTESEEWAQKVRK